MELYRVRVRKNMITEIQLSTLIFIAAFIWAIFLILQGTPISKELFDPFSNVIGITVLLLAIFDKWAWHCKIFYPWLVSTPYLEGTWKGEVKSNWINSENEKASGNIEAYLSVRQKFTRIYASLITKESSSELLTGELIKNPDETWRFVGAYRNTPKVLLRGRSPIHHGAVIFNVKGKTPTGLEGQYWTDRNTQGEMDFSEYSKKKHQDFASASNAYYYKRH
jgi:hypothetical protein